MEQKEKFGTFKWRDAFSKAKHLYALGRKEIHYLTLCFVRLKRHEKVFFFLFSFELKMEDVNLLWFGLDALVVCFMFTNLLWKVF